MCKGLRLLLSDLFMSLGLFLSDLMTGTIIVSLFGRKIKSDKGFSVKLLGRDGLLYSEGKKHVYIYSEIAGGDTYFMWIAKSSMRRWGRYGLGRVISEEEKDRIINNIREHFRSQGREIKVG